jgi:hypothetical protein
MVAIDTATWWLQENTTNKSKKKSEKVTPKTFGFALATEF